MSESGSASHNYQVHVPFDDLREWIAKADKLGELRHAEGYTWEEEIGMAAELLQHDDEAPVALFDKISGPAVSTVDPAKTPTETRSRN